jgi:hypothetical protein
MDWRLFSAVTLAGASFSMVAFGAYSLRAADAVPHGAGRSAPLLVAPSLTPLNIPSAATTVGPDRGVTFAPFAPNGATPGDAVAAPAAEHPDHAAVELTTFEGASPALVADLPVSQERVVRSSWRHRHHVTWKVEHHAKFCTELQPCGTDHKQQQVAVKHTEEHAPKMALVLGVGF